MDCAAFIRASTLGGPGHDGYAYCADVYCVECGEEIVREIAARVAPTLTGTEDRLFKDSETCPQPIFFGESATAQHCGECGEYLYGSNDKATPAGTGKCCDDCWAHDYNVCGNDDCPCHDARPEH